MAKIDVKGTSVTVISGGVDDYTSLTDIARYKDSERTDYIIQNRLRNRNTIEFLGIWEQLNNPDFNPIEFDGIQAAGRALAERGAGMKLKVGNDSGYGRLLEQISGAYTQGRARAAQAVNTALIDTYWQVGRHIVEFEQGGEQRAAYGKALLEQLARDLTLRHGKGFSRSNLNHMRLFYQCYPICEKASHKLSWSHYVELLKLDDELERGFYERQSLAEGWSVPELKRQKASRLFLRLAASKDNLIPPRLPQQINLIYASEAGLLNTALLGNTAKQWRDEPPGNKGKKSDGVILREAKRSRRIHSGGYAMTKSAFVYILASRKNGTLYTGVTSDLERRIYQHKHHLFEGFTSRYDVTRLVWYAQGADIASAISLEKKIKNRNRQWKVDLIEKSNPDWDDLAADWMDSATPLCSARNDEGEGA